MSIFQTLVAAVNTRGDVRDGRLQGREQPVLRSPAQSHAEQAFTSLFVSASDQLRLHVRLYGSRCASALPVVCLPGLARTAADFHSVACALTADPGEPRCVAALDYRGHGRSE